jgi:predicted nuclease of restriction endonuclease-like (RecB) superfamily
MSVPENGQYLSVLAELKAKISRAKIQAIQAVNERLLQLYWEIGHTILMQQESVGWGNKIIKNLASDLKMAFPDSKGFSERNLVYMQTFAATYPKWWDSSSTETNKASVSQGFTITQPLVAQIPWTHHTIILDKTSSEAERFFYLQKTAENGWSKNVLLLQIAGDLFNRQGRSLSNFENTLPSSQSDLVQESFKSPYVFDFLALGEKVYERDLEKALLTQLKAFMLELGRGFAYYGSQMRLLVGGDEFYPDLLFFNVNLNCFVVFELKIDNFKPAHTGQLNFYINAINEQLKSDHHNPTIGVLLCRTRDETVVRYALKDLNNPIGVSEYELMTALPSGFRSEIPSVEEFEAEFEKELQDHISPADKKLQEIKALMAGLNQPKVQEKRNPENTLRILQEVVFPLRASLQTKLHEIAAAFEAQEWMLWTSNQGFETDQALIDWLAANNYTHEFRLEIRLSGFIPAGTKAFNIFKRCTIWLQDYVYGIGTDQQLPQNALLTKLYHELPNEREWTDLIEQMALPILEEIELKIKELKGAGHE